jgi:hypothetical protein
LIVLFALAVLGGFVGYGVGAWVKGAQGDVRFPNWSDAGALFLALALAAQGLAVVLLSFNRRVAGVAFGGGDATRPATPQQLSFYRQQAGILLLAGVMLALPVATPLITGALSNAAAIAVMIVIALCFAAQTALNLIVWRRADEFVRRLISETGSLCFWVLQAALFLWAAGERLGVFPAIDAWSCVVVLMGVYLLASAFISMRNGVGV